MNTELPTNYDAFLQTVLAREIDQSDVFEGVLALDTATKERLGGWAASVLEQEEPSSREGLRAAQFAAALLPTALSTVLLGLRSRSDEVKFAVICSLTDVPRRVLARLAPQLVPAVWVAALTSWDSDVQVIAADFMRLVSRKAVRAEVEGRDLTYAPDLFLWLLAKDVFGRRLPRSLARESFLRKRYWRSSMYRGLWVEEE
ncbi:hypothetical protein EON82_20900 [bacterium]|nr:MAG: hypothetical protein EON82_20900 [bacterium]